VEKERNAEDTKFVLFLWERLMEYIVVYSGKHLQSMLPTSSQPPVMKSLKEDLKTLERISMGELFTSRVAGLETSKTAHMIGSVFRGSNTRSRKVRISNSVAALEIIVMKMPFMSLCLLLQEYLLP
jgi:hypothetical protein